MENPAVVFACTVDVIVPLVFDDVVAPFAFQHHATCSSVFLLTLSKLPTVNPS